MAHNSLFVFARIHPHKENFTDAKNAILGIVEKTLEEPGCLQFKVHQDIDNSTLCLYEEWTDESALAEHYAQTYTAAVFESYKQWLAAPVEIVKMQQCEKN